MTATISGCAFFLALLALGYGLGWCYRQAGEPFGEVPDREDVQMEKQEEQAQVMMAQLTEPVMLYAVAVPAFAGNRGRWRGNLPISDLYTVIEDALAEYDRGIASGDYLPSAKVCGFDCRGPLIHGMDEVHATIRNLEGSVRYHVELCREMMAERDEARAKLVPKRRWW